MKTRRIILIVTANLAAVFVIVGLINRKNQVNRFRDRFRPNAFIMSDSLIIDVPVENVYNYYIHHYHEIYSQTADKHYEFVLLNSDSITEGTKIFCREGEENAMIYHDYIVRKVIPNQLVYKSSEPSVIKNETKDGNHESICNCFVYVDFKEMGKLKSQVKFTIIVQMPNYVYKLIGRILGGKEAKTEWENHLYEELAGFRDVFYRETQITSLN